MKKTSNARKQKEVVVEEIFKNISDSKSLVIAEYKGLTVKEIQNLRKQLAEKDVVMKVYKNRLFKLASKKAGFDFGDDLVGQNAFVFGMSDEISPAKVIDAFSQTNDLLNMKAGTFEGKVVDRQGILDVAKLPTLEEALTMLASSMIAPIRYTGVGLNMLATEGHLEESKSTKEDK